MAEDMKQFKRFVSVLTPARIAGYVEEECPEWRRTEDGTYSNSWDTAAARLPADTDPLAFIQSLAENSCETPGRIIAEIAAVDAGERPIGHPNVLAADFHLRMQAVALHDCQEQGHRLADRLLCELVRRLGLTEIVTEYRKIPKWYA